MNKVTIIHPRLQHLGMTTANTDTMLDWYRTVLGMSLVHRTSSATGDQKSGPNLMAAWVSNDEANHRLAFVQLPGVITENLVCMPTPSAEENDRGGLEVAERRVLDRKAGSAKRNPVSAREEIALVNTTNGSYSRRSTD